MIDNEYPLNEYPLNDPRGLTVRKDDFNALVAEVERLRKECGQAYLQGVKAGRDAERIAERAAVVAWLRECALDPEATGAEMRLLQEQATRIERGEHRREEKP
jgi:hypothetical protein